MSSNARLQALPYTAALLSDLLDDKVSPEDLTKDKKGAKDAIGKLLKSNEKGNEVKITLKGKKTFVGRVGLPPTAITKLKAAAAALGATAAVLPGFRW